MPYCQNCGSPVDGRYCSKCGAPVSAEAEAPTTPPPPGATLQDNVAGALCYIPLLGVIFLLVEPYSRNRLVRFHAFQSLFLVVALIVLSMVLTSMFAIFWGMWGLFGLWRLAVLLLWLFLMYKTYKGEKIVLPVIGPLAEKQA